MAGWGEPHGPVAQAPLPIDDDDLWGVDDISDPAGVLNEPAQALRDAAELDWWRHFRAKLTFGSEMPAVGSPLLGYSWRVERAPAEPDCRMAAACVEPEPGVVAAPSLALGLGVVDDFDALARGTAEEKDTEIRMVAQAALERRLEVLRFELGIIQQDLKNAMLAEMVRADRWDWSLPGVAQLTRHKNAKRTAWQYDALIARLRTMLLERAADRATGETVTVAQAVEMAMGELRDCISFSGGRLTGIRRRGLAVDEYCTEAPDGTFTIEIRGV